MLKKIVKKIWGFIPWAEKFDFSLMIYFINFIHVIGQYFIL